MRQGKFVLKEINQVCVVVEDLKGSMERYWKLFGLGPWSVYTFAPPELTDMIVRGKPETYSMKIGLTNIGPLMFELIQPLEGESIYKEFLEKKGEGLHHIASFKLDDVEEAIEYLKKQGISVLQSGRWHGSYFAYMDTEKTLGMVVELVKRTKERPPPEEIYP